MVIKVYLVEVKWPEWSHWRVQHIFKSEERAKIAVDKWGTWNMGEFRIRPMHFTD